MYDIEPLPVQLRAVAKPAPFVLKPFAGLYNPYPYGCSLLCNHPTDSEAKELLKKAKDSWATEGRNLLLPEEIIAIRSGLEQLNVTHEQRNFAFRNSSNLELAVESVPEELFRRYTETDSRPVTPAPTLASGATRASNSRRCFTPEPIPTTKVQEKTLLILDLRRSHSQETLSWYGVSTLEPPLIRIQHVPTTSGSVEESPQGLTSVSKSCKSKSPHTLTTPSPGRRPRSKLTKEPRIEVLESDEPKTVHEGAQDEGEAEEEEEEEFVRRRGKKKRRRGSRGAPAFQASIDPETQVATIGSDSRNTSARPSLVPGGASQDIQEVAANAADKSRKKSLLARSQKSLEIESFLDVDILRELRRELTKEIVETEFNIKRRTALEEAMKAVPKEKIINDELKAIKKDLNLPPVNADLWLHLPRVFTRSSIRFELPLDSRTLKTMTPLEYLKDNVYISSTRKLVYNCVFNKFKEEEPEEHIERKLSGKNVQAALNVMMGKALNEKQKKYFHDLVGWIDCDVFDFKTFCGICALCERLLAKEYCPQLPDKKTDPCHEVETADFEPLTRKLRGQNCDERLVKILYGIKNS